MPLGFSYSNLGDRKRHSGGGWTYIWRFQRRWFFSTHSQHFEALVFRAENACSGEHTSNFCLSSLECMPVMTASEIHQILCFILGKWAWQGCGRRCHFLLFFPSPLFLMRLLLLCQLCHLHSIFFLHQGHFHSLKRG